MDGGGGGVGWGFILLNFVNLSAIVWPIAGSDFWKEIDTGFVNYDDWQLMPGFDLAENN